MDVLPPGVPSVEVPGSVLMLGGTGFIGSAVSRLLASEGYNITIVTRRQPEMPDPWSAEVEWINGDASDPNLYDSILDGATHVVYLLTGLSPVESNRTPLMDITQSLTPLLLLLDALRQRPHIKLIFLSSGGTVYGNPRTLPVSEDHPTDPTSSYGILKLTAEKYIGMYAELYGIQARILRIANAYGPRQRTGRGQGVIGEFVNSILENRPLTIFGDGGSVRDYIYVDDVAIAVAAALKSQGPRVMNIGTGVGTSLLQLHQLFEDILGTSLPLEAKASRGFDVAAIVLDGATFLALTGHSPIDLRTGIDWTLRAAREELSSEPPRAQVLEAERNRDQ